MRALLVVNPKATTTTERTRDVLVHALSSDLKLDLVATQHRGHALELARQARRDRLDVVVTLGGDGTVNEVVNGLLEDGPGPDVPALALVPGGSANVLARALGLPPDPVEATGQLLEAIAEERTRAIGLGTADDRWFTFCAGLGLDAEVIAAVERARARGVRATPALYVRSAIREFFRSTDRDDPLLTLEAPGQDPVHEIFLAIVQSTSPWTYLGGLPVNPCPQASFDTALSLTGKAGDLVFWDSRIWHGARENVTGGTRWSVIATFCRWWIKQAFDIPGNLPQEIYDQLSDRQRAVLGFCSVPYDDESRGIDMKRSYALLPANVADYRL